MTIKHIIHIAFIGLILFLLSACTARTQKELVYHRDQNNRLYVATEVQHIKHEQVMDLMPQNQLVIGFGDYFLFLHRKDTLGNYQRYIHRIESNKRIVRSEIMSYISGVISFGIGYMILTFSQLYPNSDFLYYTWITLLLIGFAIIFGSFIWICISLIEYRILQKFKRRNNISYEISPEHKRLLKWAKICIASFILLYGVLITLALLTD